MRPQWSNSQLFVDAQHESYLDFSRLDEESTSKLLSLFDVFVLRTEPYVSFSLLHLESTSIFIDSIFDLSEVTLVVLPAKMANLHLESILKDKEARSVRHAQSFPTWSLSRSKMGLLRFNPAQMFTTDTLLPILEPQKPFRKQSGSSGRNSNQVNQGEVFDTFLDIHRRKNIQKWPISMNLQQVAGITTEHKPLTVVLKLFVPHLNVAYNHSVHHLDSHTPFEQVWQIFARATRMTDFYLFYEVQTNPTKKDKFYNITFLEMLESPSPQTYSAYWPIISNILTKKLSLKVRLSDTVKDLILGRIVHRPLYLLHSFILVPSIISLYPQLRTTASESPSKPAQEPPSNLQSAFDSNPPTPTGSSSQRQSHRIESEKTTPKKPSQSIADPPNVTSSPTALTRTGKRPHLGMFPDDQSPNSDSSRTRKSIKKVQVETTEMGAGRARGQQSTRLLYLDLAVLMSFLDLFRSFENLIYCNVSVLDRNQFRKLAVDMDITDLQFFKVLFRRLLNEKYFLRYILDNNSRCSGSQLLFANGNLCYGNGPTDKYFCSVPESLPDNIYKINPHFSSMIGTLYMLWFTLSLHM